jgi:hypothetical protein
VVLGRQVVAGAQKGSRFYIARRTHGPCVRHLLPTNAVNQDFESKSLELSVYAKKARPVFMADRLVAYLALALH